VSQRDQIRLDSSREPNDSDRRKGLDGTDGPSDEVIEEVLRVFWNLASALMKVASKALPNAEQNRKPNGVLMPQMNEHCLSLRNT
jgi:hypothetical protein